MRSSQRYRIAAIAAIAVATVIPPVRSLPAPPRLENSRAGELSNRARAFDHFLRGETGQALARLDPDFWGGLRDSLMLRPERAEAFIGPMNRVLFVPSIPKEFAAPSGVERTYDSLLQNADRLPPGMREWLVAQLMAARFKAAEEIEKNETKMMSNAVLTDPMTLQSLKRSFELWVPYSPATRRNFERVRLAGRLHEAVYARATAESLVDPGEASKVRRDPDLEEQAGMRIESAVFDNDARAYAVLGDHFNRGLIGPAENRALGLELQRRAILASKNPDNDRSLGSALLALSAGYRDATSVRAGHALLARDFFPESVAARASEDTPIVGRLRGYRSAIAGSFGAFNEAALDRYILPALALWALATLLSIGLTTGIWTLVAAFSLATVGLAAGMTLLSWGAFTYQRRRARSIIRKALGS